MFYNVVVHGRDVKNPGHDGNQSNLSHPTIPVWVSLHSPCLELWNVDMMPNCNCVTWVGKGYGAVNYDQEQLQPPLNEISNYKWNTASMCIPIIFPLNSYDAQITWYAIIQPFIYTFAHIHTHIYATVITVMRESIHPLDTHARSKNKTKPKNHK